MLENYIFQNISDLKKIEKNLNREQYVLFNCSKCNAPSFRKLYKVKKCNYNMLCSNCLRTQTCLKKYGTEKPSQSFSVKEKIKTNVSNSWQQKSVEEKQSIKNKLKQSGDKKSVKEKRKRTNLERYGKENPAQSSLVKEKSRQTCLEKYEVTYTSQIKESREKAKQTWQNKSFEEIFELQEKRKLTCKEKYGVDSFSKTNKFKEKAKQTWGSKSSQDLKEIRSKASKKYTYQSLNFDSSWELAIWIWAQDTNTSIKKEPIGFKYEFENQIHTYFPDFEIDDKLVEVKGTHFFKEDGTMQNPFNHDLDQLFEAKHQCGLRNNVEFWTEKDVQFAITYIEEKYGKDYLKSFKAC